MEMNQFIKVGDKVFSAETFCQLLGINPVSGMKVAVGMPAVGGTLEASVALGDPCDCPCIETSFCTNEEPSILLSHTEQDVNEKDDNGEPIVRTFLYDRAESYVAYLDHKVCPEDDLGDEILQAKLVAGGDRDVSVNVYRENQFVSWRGPLN